MFKGLGQLGDMAGMMKKAQEMQTKMAEMQDELNSITVTGESGAGLVTATATAKGELTAKKVEIHAAGASKAAVEAVEKVGGKIIVPAVSAE